MMLLDLCDNAEVLESMRIVRIIITIVRIIVPIILIVSVMLTYLKAVKDNDSDALNKANKATIIKVVAAILIFFIPSIVNLIADMVDVNKESYLSCLDMATEENIAKSTYNKAKEYVDTAYNTLTQSDYQIAVTEVNKIKDQSLKNSLLSKLNEINSYIDLKNRILSLKNYSGSDFRDRYNEVASEIGDLNNSTIKEKFQKLLDEVSTTRPLNLTSGLSKSKTYGKMSYYEVIPPNPTTNMALWVFLHGDGGQTTGGFTNFIASGKAYKTEEFFYVAPSPIPFRQDWSGGSIPSDLKSLIDHLVNEYEIDKDRIIISGFSRGAIGTWTMVNKYPDLFSVAYPISCRPVGVSAKNFLTTVVRAHAGSVYGKAGMYEGNYADDMSGFVKEIQKLGGDATFTLYPGKKHGEVNYVLELPETIEFALKTTKKRK